MLILCQMTNYIFIPLLCSGVNESVDYHVTVLSLLANYFGIFLRGWFYKVSRFLFEIEWNKILRNKRAHTVSKVKLCLHTCCSCIISYQFGNDIHTSSRILFGEATTTKFYIRKYKSYCSRYCGIKNIHFINKH
mgnify:CR=1 FL=1